MPKKVKRKSNLNAGPAGNASITSTPQAKKRSTNALIIGIDFGTTFSGVAWHNTASEKTHPLRDWPNQSQSSTKVPTVLRYTQKGTQWGHVRPTATNRLEWFKLLLNEREHNTPAELLHQLETNGLNGYPESVSMHLASLRSTINAMPTGKRPVDLATDYLREVYKYARLKLEQSFPSLKEDLGREGGVEIRCCLTVPAMWHDRAKELTRQAAIDAGIDEKEIEMISEPEAAAVHTLTSLEEVKGTLKVGDVYLIVDCGGGTVDMIPYQVTSIDPLRVSECNVGSGGLYGSTLLTRRFESLVVNRIGQQAYDEMEEEDRLEMRNYFDTQIKPRFFPDNDDDDDGVPCLLPGVPDDLGKGVRKRKITFSTNEIKGIFEMTFTEITALVQEQVTAAEAATEKNVDAMILVGGFGSSDYLAKWLEAHVTSKDGMKVKLIRPLDPSSAIVLGAVQHGLQLYQAGSSSQWGIVESRKARYNYGISISVPFLRNVHPRDKLLMDPFLGIPLCTGRMAWFIRKGENMRQGISINSEFSRRCPIIGSHPAQNAFLVINEDIYASAEDAAPADMEDPSVHKLLTYTVDLTNVPRNYFTRRRGMMGLEYWDIPAVISLKLESADLTFTTLIAGRPCGEGKKLYHHEDMSGTIRKTPPTWRRWRHRPLFYAFVIICVFWFFYRQRRGRGAPLTEGMPSEIRDL